MTGTFVFSSPVRHYDVKQDYFTLLGTSQNYEKRLLNSAYRSTAWSNSSPTEGILMKLDIELFPKICRGKSSLIKIWQK